MKRMLSSLLAALLLAMAALPVCAEEGHVQQLLNAMSLRDKVSQMLMVDFRYWDQEVPLNEKGEIDEKRQTRLTAMNEQVEDVLSTHRFGAVIYFAQNLMWTRQAYELTMAMQRAATKDGGLPLLILDVIHAAEKDGKTTIVQSVDKPYDVQSYSEADAVLAVYGCKGSTVDPTEALTGGITASEAACGPNIMAGIEVALGVYGARGMLAVNVPRFADGGYTEEIVFERGRGLFYDAVR